MENYNSEISPQICDNLWPLILECNNCEIKSTDTAEYFIPQQQFDHLWAHELLASKNYENYAPPIELKCKKSSEKHCITTAEEEEIKQLPYRENHTKILPLDQQLANIQQDVEIRQKLARDFNQRNYPWYIQRPSYENDFQMTQEIREIFKKPFEYEILKNIQRCQCNLMIIDMAPDIPLRNLEGWLKFSPYVALITVIHVKELYGKLKNFNSAFQPVLMETDKGNTWQEVLNDSLELGVNKAKELFLLEDAGKPFVFVFSNNRGICVWDKFKILKKF
ncbi:uncharacterized protein LOC119606857 [Lucilia sericata]|uniref:uncharacterized protein LOC119606857 n=1 Tax=Lucilia sericata TaxID=13632 RepID=UPI0018A837B1|nr:uncharacterized protein LOC119606857 [Lucilia sericata]